MDSIEKHYEDELKKNSLKVCAVVGGFSELAQGKGKMSVLVGAGKGLVVGLIANFIAEEAGFIKKYGQHKATIHLQAKRDFIAKEVAKILIMNNKNEVDYQKIRQDFELLNLQEMSKFLFYLQNPHYKSTTLQEEGEKQDLLLKIKDTYLFSKMI